MTTRVVMESGLSLLRIDLATTFPVMPGLVPGIHVFLCYAGANKTWMAGTSPAMTPLITAPSRRSPLVQPHDRGFRERVEIELKADDCRRGIGGNRQFIDADRKHREQVAVGMVALRRTGAAVTGRTEVGAGLQRARRQLGRPRITGVDGKFADVGRNVDDEPVPETAAGRRVRIVAGDRDAFRACRRPRPRQMRRFVSAGATEAEIGGEDVIGAEIVAVLEAVAGHGEGHVGPPGCGFASPRAAISYTT